MAKAEKAVVFGHPPLGWRCCECGVKWGLSALEHFEPGCGEDILRPLPLAYPSAQSRHTHLYALTARGTLSTNTFLHVRGVYVGSAESEAT